MKKKIVTICLTHEESNLIDLLTSPLELNYCLGLEILKNYPNMKTVLVNKFFEEYLDTLGDNYFHLRDLIVNPPFFKLFLKLVKCGFYHVNVYECENFVMTADYNNVFIKSVYPSELDRSEKPCFKICFSAMETTIQTVTMFSAHEDVTLAIYYE